MTIYKNKGKLKYPNAINLRKEESMDKRTKLEVKKLKAKKKTNERKIRELKKKISDRNNRQTELCQKWFDRLAAVRQELDNALQIETGYLKTNKRFLSDHLQEIAKQRQKLQKFKDQDILAQPVQNKFYNDYVEKLIGPNNADKKTETKHHRLRITATFWDNLFAASPASEVEKEIKLYLEKVAEAEKIINQSQAKTQELTSKISAILQKAKENKTIAMRLGPDLDKLKNLQPRLESDSLKPRDLRQIEYELNQIKKKYKL